MPFPLAGAPGVEDEVRPLPSGACCAYTEHATTGGHAAMRCCVGGAPVNRDGGGSACQDISSRPARGGWALARACVHRVKTAALAPRVVPAGAEPFIWDFSPRAAAQKTVAADSARDRMRPPFRACDGLSRGLSAHGLRAPTPAHVCAQRGGSSSSTSGVVYSVNRPASPDQRKGKADPH